jgi:CoA:oxalate CoA-transferase
MVDGLFSTLENAVVRYTSRGEVARALGTAHPSITPFQAFRASDNWIIIAIGSDKLWDRFCTVLRRNDLIDDDRFRTNPLRTENREILAGILAGEINKKTVKEWADIFDREGIPYSPVNDIRQICEDPHIKLRHMLVEVDQKGVGRVKIAGSPLRLSETPGRVYQGAPALGENTEEVLCSWLSMTQAEIRLLREDGVIN